MKILVTLFGVVACYVLFKVSAVVDLAHLIIAAITITAIFVFRRKWYEYLSLLFLHATLFFGLLRADVLAESTFILCLVFLGLIIISKVKVNLLE